MLASRVFTRGISLFVSIKPLSSTTVLPPKFHGLYLSRHSFSRQSSHIATTLHPREEPLPLGTVLKSDSGQIFRIEEILAGHRNPLLSVYRARADELNFIAKHLIPGEFEYQLNLQKKLASCQNVRTVVDTIRDLDLFIYPFLAGDLLHLSQRSLNLESRIHILRSALHGLAFMHDQGTLHNGKSRHPLILINYDESTEGELSVKAVQISDLDDTVLVPPGKWLRGPLCGNAMWRSPESWCRSRQNQASDIFSFGIVMIYVMLNEMVFRVRDSQLTAADSWRYILQRHVSYFADEQGLNGLLEHIGEDNPFHGRFISIASNFTSDTPRQPFASWEYVDQDLRDLVCKMTNLDPTKRITATQALQHRWFMSS